MPFGTKQLKNPTPKKVNDLFDLLSAIFGVLSGYLTTAAWVSHSVSDVVVSILSGLFIPLCLILKRYFGVEITQDEEIPRDQIKVIEQPPSSNGLSKP